VQVVTCSFLAGFVYCNSEFCHPN